MNKPPTRVRLSYGDWIAFDDEKHKVVGLIGPCVRL
jgi:hypothetical protein